MQLTYDTILGRCKRWGDEHEDVRAMVVIGSRARIDQPADEWSDLDLLIITTDVERYLAGGDWLALFGVPWATFIERQATGGGYERRVLFEGALDIDFAPLPPDIVWKLLEDTPPEIAAIFRRGFRVILDKDGFGPHLARAAQQAEDQSARLLPTEQEFLSLWNDFYYHAVWSAKKLRRGELWTAKSCVDGYMKARLLELITWHAKAAHGEDYDTWHTGRFHEKWADPRAITGLHTAFGFYEDVDMRRALLATLDLFRWLARETAENLRYSYPSEADQNITDWVERCLAVESQPRSSV